ncbi:LysR family transcriptional regulator [Burkholderia plantarii]|uniref:LysR family transcriptional regulator n=1 Tax=Burkholderia plantarii TaxID=41899 RepID=UPI00272A06FA|nr:LysR family transcriptional regulator [Burkholderia plantarii]WLE59902.1 LysR family transcriptional regulator [Burkholderia plantarii]
MDRLTSLEVFVRVAGAGSFAAASKGLDMTPAMIGRYIQNLEDHLGVALINRNTRNQSLTESGQMFLEHCQCIITDIKTAEALVRDNTHSARHNFRITAPVLLGTEVVSELLAEYLATHAHTSIDFSLSDNFEDVMNGQFDLAVRIGKMGNSSLIARPLGQFRFIVCASPQYLAKHGTPRRPEDLSAHHCLATGYGGKEHAWEFIGADGTTQRVRIPSRYRINNRGALRSAAIAGGGIIMQPLISLGPSLRAGQLVELLQDWQVPPKPINLVWPQNLNMTKQARELIDFLIARMQSLLEH